jgi:hypothetical protein
MSRLRGPVDASLLPRDPVSGEALQPTREPGYYPRFSTLSQSPFWDEATRSVVEKRVDSPPEQKFFTEAQWQFWEAVFAHLIPQTDRTADRQIPLVASLDQRLYANRTIGYRYDVMPHDCAVYTKFGIDAINLEAQAQFSGDFLLLPHLQQDRVLKAIHDRKPIGGKAIWKKMSIHRFWQLIMGDAIDAYYAHPWAWDEVGFGGPAYPRAYTRLERGEPEPWEVEERAYDWLAPSASVSDEVESTARHHTEANQNSHTAQPRSK